MKRFEIFFGIIKIPVDFIMTVLAFLAAYQLRLITEPIKGIAKPIDYSVLPTLNEYLIFSRNAGLVLLIIFTLGKMYSLKSTSKFSQETRKSLVLCGVWAMTIITYFFFTRTFPFSRLAMLYSWGLTLIFIIFGRALIRLVQRGCQKIGMGQHRLIFIGNNNITKELNGILCADSSYKILGVVAENSAIKDLEKIIRKHEIDEIIQTKSDSSDAQNESILEFCEFHHIDYRFVPDLIAVRLSNVETNTIGGIPIISIKQTPLDGWGKVTKRIIDMIGATLGLILLSPIMLLTAIAIKIDSKGPILFSKLEDGSPAKRVGQKDKLFKFYKFRSMYSNTHSLRYTELTKNNLRKDGPLMKIKNDPRITNVGRFLRRYSIDELPQLWNVLIGNMSLVGPRPHLPEEVAKYKNHHRFVLTIKPGLTGLPQISGRSDLSFEEEVKLDRFYIENWSIWRDIKIIFRTLGVILRGYQE